MESFKFNQFHMTGPTVDQGVGTRVMPRSVMKEAMGLQMEKGVPLSSVPPAISTPTARLSVVRTIRAPESPPIPGFAA